MKDHQPVTGADVKQANRAFYDAVADRYEAVDGRRSDELAAWLRSRLQTLRDTAPGGRLMDLGAGSGFVSRCAKGVFASRVGVDISPQILEANRDVFDETKVADLDDLPFPDGSFDVIVCFAVLHHLFAFEKVVAEVCRVLKPGGIFCSDHDMDRTFFQRFKSPLRLYRWCRNDQKRYAQSGGAVDASMYRLAEWQETGVDSEQIAALFRARGCEVKRTYHWYGLTGCTNRLFGPRAFRRGWAPLLALEARRAR